MKHYHFNVPEPKRKITLETDLIPRALAEARKVDPDESIKLMWEGRIYKDLEENKPSNWREFISSLIP